MAKFPLLVLKYYFSCVFLWYVLSLYLYLEEKVAKEEMGSLSANWAKASENLAKWVIEERHYLLLNHEEILQEKEEPYFLIGERLGDSLMFYFADAIHPFAIDLHSKFPAITKSRWLYFSYCGFLSQVLQEFDNIMRELGDAVDYYKRYQASVGLFNELADAVERERPFSENPRNVDEATIRYYWAVIDELANKLGWNGGKLYTRPPITSGYQILLTTTIFKPENLLHGHCLPALARSSICCGRCPHRATL